MTQSKSKQGLPRRTISELVTRYRLEPDLRDLFVEGPRDREIYGWYLETSGCKLLTAFTIESVEISTDLLDSYGLASGNRNRVVALALELDKNFSPALRHVRCVADRDFDFILNVHKCARHLLYTDCTSVDLYTCHENLLRKVFRLGFHIPDLEIAEFFDSLISVLQDVFVIRAANERLGWGMTPVSFTKCCEVNGPVITFDKNKFISRYLISNSRIGDQLIFEKHCTELQTVSPMDPRQSIRGADYFELVGWYLKKRSRSQGYGEGDRSIRANVVPLLDHDILSKEPLFTQLDDIIV